MVDESPDITESLIHAQGSPMVVTDGERISFANRKFLSLFELVSVDSLSSSGRRLYHRFVPGKGTICSDDHPCKDDGDWLKQVRSNDLQGKVSILVIHPGAGHAFQSTFLLQSSSIPGSDSYIITFTDISLLESMYSVQRDQLPAVHPEPQDDKSVSSIPGSAIRYEVLFQSSADALFVLALKNDIVQPYMLAVNRAASAMLGYSSYQLASMRFSAIRLFGNLEEPLMIESIPTMGLVMNVDLLSASGEQIPCELRVTRFREDDLELLLVSARDISDRIRLEQESRERERLISHQSRMASMGEMIGAIAHQWRQPLSAISLLVQDLDDAFEYGELDRDYMKESTSRVIDQIDFMLTTIDDFRNFFRPNLLRTPFELQDAVEKVIRLLDSRFKTQNITIQFMKHSDKKVLVDGYRNELQHVILNILNNSREAILQKRKEGISFAGQITIDITPYHESSSITDAEYNRVLLVCDDNGPGVTSSVLEHLFEPYVTTKGESGTGIGLYLSRMILRKIGATIHIENRPEGGARVTLDLPGNIIIIGE